MGAFDDDDVIGHLSHGKSYDSRFKDNYCNKCEWTKILDHVLLLL